MSAADGVATVDAGAGLRFDVAVPSGTSADDAVELVIRPENIRLHAPAGGNGATIGRITDSTFLGNISEYHRDACGRAVLRVQTHPRQQFAVGDDVAVASMPASALCFAGRVEIVPGVATARSANA